MRWLRRIGVVLAILLAVVALLVGAASFWLRSDAAARRARDTLVKAANGAIAGRLSVGSVRPGLRTIVLSDLDLFDPDGALVAHLDSLSLDANLASLAHRKVHVRSLDLSGARLLLAGGPEGLNLARAVEARRPSTGASRPSAWEVVVDALSLSGLEAEYRPAPASPPAVAGRVEKLEASGASVPGACR